MIKILITGSNGLLGQKLVHKLVLRKDVQLIATSLGENRMNMKAGYVYEPLDITNASAVNDVVKRFTPNVIINTAAMTNVDACESKRDEAFSLNVKAVQNLIDAITANTPNTHLIHLSTDFIFDGLKGSEYMETDTPNPGSYYAITKLESEQLLQNSNIKWAIARTIIVYGIADKMSRTNLVLWAKDALTKGQKINVVDDQFRAPTLAEDLADGCILIADKGATGIYHLAGPKTFSVLDLVYQVAEVWNLDKSLITPSKTTTINQAAQRPPYTGFIIDKARKELGYNPHSFIDGLKIVAGQLT